MATKKKVLSDKVTLDDLAKLIGASDFDKLYESNSDYAWDAGRAAVPDDWDGEITDSPDFQEAEEAANSALWKAWQKSVLAVIEPLFDEHKLDLAEIDSYNYKIVPKTTWEVAADAIRRTINGVGYFEFSSLREFLSSGPYTARQAVLLHLGSIPDWTEVYEGGSTKHAFERELEDNMRYL